MVKPFGPICNLDCSYCYYLEKEALYPPGEDFRMSPRVLEPFVQQYLASQDVPEVTFAWQGGEPTLLGVDFFREVVRLQGRYADGKRVTNAIQTNGTRLDDEWCAFLAEHRFLVGLSVDGPRHLHDAYRLDKGGRPTFDKVMEGLGFLQKHGTDYNTLTVVNRVNSQEPSEVYRFLKEIGSRFHQFIPLVERKADAVALELGLSLSGPPGPTPPSGGSIPEETAGDPGVLAPADHPGPWGASSPVTPWSVEARQWGEFLVKIFDEWVRNDVSQVFVQLFDVTLAAWTGSEPPLCVFAQTCGDALVLEHNGDLFSCDHYVYPEYLLGNITETPMRELVRKPEQIAFGQAKKDDLPRYCLECPVRFACNGECPKHRFLNTPDGEPGLNYLCAGYKRFFTHVRPQMDLMAELLQRGRAPAEIVGMMARQDQEARMRTAGRNDPCPCGSGKKFKNCCGSQ
jgi:uncharacterized protein